MMDIWYWILGIALLVGLYILARNWRASESPPEPSPTWWEAIFTRPQWENFNQLLNNYFLTRHIRFEIDQQRGVIHLEKNHQLGLMNISQQCAQADHLLWPKIISGHFDHILQAHNLASQEMLDFQEAEFLLALRIWPEGILETIGQHNLLYRQDLPGTISALVLDYPNAVQTLKAEAAARWNIEIEDLFQRARDNLRRRLAPRIEQQQISEQLAAYVFTSDSIYVTSSALWLEDFPKCLGSHGALLGIPTRHHLLCTPLDEQLVLPAIHELITLIYHIAQKGPGTITDNLYWYHQGVFTVLPYQIKNQQIAFQPPESFNRLMMLLNRSSAPVPGSDQNRSVVDG